MKLSPNLLRKRNLLIALTSFYHISSFPAVPIIVEGGFLDKGQSSICALDVILMCFLRNLKTSVIAPHFHTPFLNEVFSINLLYIKSHLSPHIPSNHLPLSFYLHSWTHVGVCLYTHCLHFPLLVTLQLLYLTPAPVLHMHFVTKVRVTNSGVHFSIPTSLLL